MTTVLVTGGSGFIAGHCILQLLESGYEVRATVRSTTREPAVRAALGQAGEGLRLVGADLRHDDGWAEAVRGCDAVLHVASPVAPGRVDDEAALIATAREGSRRVLRAARTAGVRRVVLTSAFHAVGFGHPHSHGVFTEDDWSVPDGPGVDAYGRSKIEAERAAWRFVADGGPELVTILPVAVVGPVLGGTVSGANELLERLLTGRLPGLPDLAIPVVDVRDVARAHVAAIAAPGAAGRRILVSSGPAIPMAHIAATLREHLGAAAAKVPTRRIPNPVVRLGALFSPEFRTVAAELGLVKRISDERARTVLGLRPRPAEEAIVAAGRSLVDRAA
ncbi:NAD-dependent epimerase/dehydratase family protein [Actinomycetospora sp. CA-084318]|uniref:NAD-dependent epimerase/dehydratase family protein n=1 Tax=Actinomycetospora sp. CA-084318 TaxID=3239892 RepID=UPI003D99D98D